MSDQNDNDTDDAELRGIDPADDVGGEQDSERLEGADPDELGEHIDPEPVDADQDSDRDGNAAGSTGGP